MTVISWQRRRVRCVDHVMGWKGRIKLGHERGVWYCFVAANLYRRGSKTGSRGEGIGMHLSVELTFSKCRFGLLGICHYDGRLLPRSGNSCVRWAVSRQTSANAFKSALKPTSPAWELVPQSIWGRTRSTGWQALTQTGMCQLWAEPFERHSREQKADPSLWTDMHWDSKLDPHGIEPHEASP